MSGPADPEAGYYQAIEEFFVSRRGDPLFLSNADWVLIRKWRQKGLPLRVVLRGITDALDGHAHSWGRSRKVGSLAYCAAEVDAAADRWRRALAEGTPEASAVSRSLRAWADALEAAALGPRSRVVGTGLAEALRERAAEAGRSEGLEAWLAAQEKALLRAIEQDMGAESRARAEAEVEHDLVPYRDRLPAAVLAKVREAALARTLLGAHGLPRLSLFEL